MSNGEIVAAAHRISADIRNAEARGWKSVHLNRSLGYIAGHDLYGNLREIPREDLKPQTASDRVSSFIEMQRRALRQASQTTH